MLIAPNFYNQADQNIYNQGYSFIPQERFRGGAFNVPTTPESSTGITTLPTAMNMGGSGDQGGYNPYTPNNNVRTDFIPNTEFRQFQDFGNLTDAQLSTKDRKFMDNFPEYYGINTGVPETGIKGFLNQAINFIPGVGTLKRGAEFLGGILKNKMPINQRAILENQLRGSGVLTDDIGRIALGQGMSYNTPEGIMAGYNASKMNEGTFDKRTDKISETLGSKYGISQADIQGLIDGTLDDDDISSKYGINTNLTSNIRNITLAKQNFITQQNKAAEIAAFKEKQRQEKKQAAANARDLKTIQRRAAQGDSMSDIGRDMYTGKGQAFEKQSGGVSGKGTKNERNYGGRRDGGFIDGTNRRTDYMMGGLANLVDIYD